MLKQLVSRLAHPQRNRIYSVMRDIDYFYAYIRQNGEIDEWRFGKIFPHKYWNYLSHYHWLSPSEQEYLVTGCLNITLFMAHRFLENDDTFLTVNFSVIEMAVNNFTPNSSHSERLYYMVKEALILVWKRMHNIDVKDSENNIYKFISWTLNNTILTQPPLYKKIKNQR